MGIKVQTVNFNSKANTSLLGYRGWNIGESLVFGGSNLKMHTFWRPKWRSNREGDNINLTWVLKVLVSELTKDEKNSVFLLFSMFCLTAPGCSLESSCFTISSGYIFSQQSGTGVKNGVAKHSSLLPRIISAAKLPSYPFTYFKVHLHTHCRLWYTTYNLFQSEWTIFATQLGSFHSTNVSQKLFIKETA